MSTVTRFALVAGLFELLAGCLTVATGAADPAAGTGTASSAGVVGGPTCPDWGCGANSPTLADGVAFDELDAAGAQDRDGIRIVGAVHGSVPVMLRVDRHTLSAVATDGSGGLFSHAELIGTIVVLNKGGQNYLLKIDGIDENSLKFWAGDTTEVVPFYRILVQPPGQQKFTPVCRQNVAAKEPVWGPVEHFAIAYTGDRYDSVRKLVADEDRGPTWFNLACAGSATAKLHLMRHTNAGAWTAATWHPGNDVRASTAPFHTDVLQRQAMVKMFAADYCGTGEAFTVDGHPLLYDDSKHWFAPGSIGVPAVSVAPDGTLSPPGSTMEALWTDRGALCVSQPRLVDRSAVPCLGGAALPMCTPDLIYNWDVRVHVISANLP